ncbi:glycosyltransferase [Patescibacteria group bacterium]|nr:MAG: glycosyltransferase [Patescibacteria group bacterium]
MKLLLVTQIVDRDDAILGFFHRWIEEFSKHVESIEVICLKEGKHNLPSNVRVHSLGKEQTTIIYDSGLLKRIGYSVRFLYLIWKLRKNYDTVLVHMNPEYVILGGLFWKSWKKSIGLWYTHKSVDLKLRVAELFVDVIFTASKESFRLPSKKLQVMGHGIDTEFFAPDEKVSRGNHLLSVGRLMPTKRHDLAIRVAKDAGVALRIAGEGVERERLTALARELGVQVTFLGGLTQLGLRDEYRIATKLIHRSETGSLDKVVLEAAACGCLVDSTDPAINGLPLSPSYIREHHSLQSLIPRIIEAYVA